LIALGDGQRVAGWIAIAASFPATWLFFRVEARSAAAMMPLELFRNRDFLGANILTLFLYAGLTAALFMLPFLLIGVHGYSAKAAGAAFLPFSGIIGAGSRWAGGLVERLGSRRPLLLGPSVTAAGFAILGLTGGSSTYWSGFLPGLCVVAVGMTLSVAPLTTTVLNSVPEDRSGTASGINNALARVGGLLAVAALGLAFGSTGPSGLRGPAIAGAYRLVMYAAAGLAGLSALSAALTIGARRKR
jgi:predicted MFS family arabinose efflux permease